MPQSTSIARRVRSSVGGKHTESARKPIDSTVQLRTNPQQLRIFTNAYHICQKLGFSRDLWTY
jgi:hypothetical protein